MNSGPIQPMDLTSLRAVIEDLQRNVVPSRLEKSQQPNKWTLQLGLRTINGMKWIEISWFAEAPRIVQIPTPGKAGESSTLAKQFHNILRRMALIGIEHQGFERIVKLQFANKPGENIQKTILIEIMGRHSNLFLLDKESRIITMGRQVRENQSRKRPISTGDNYIPPPSLKGIKPSLKESFDQWKYRLCLTPVTLKNSFQETYQGLSPSLLIQLVGKKKEEAIFILKSNINNISLEEWERIFERWTHWLNSIENNVFSLRFNADNSFQVWEDGSKSRKESSQLSLRLGIYYSDLINKKSLKGLELLTHKKINNLLKSEKNSLIVQDSLLENTKNIDDIKKKADELLSLRNPSRDQIQNAQKLYLRAKKLRRSIPLIKERVQHHLLRINNIETSKVFLDEILTNTLENSYEKESNLEELYKELEDFFPTKNITHKNSKKAKIESLKPLEIFSPNGLTIQIGRNHRQNEFISIKKARKGDLWFHAQECPGSHVVLKSSNGLPEEIDIETAANLAALFSRAKGNKNVPIFLVQTSKLRRVSGGIPGTLTHTGGEVIWGKPKDGFKYLN